MSENGLSSQKALELLKIHGENRLKEGKKQSILAIFFSQFKDIMVLILLGATIVSVAMGEIYDAVTIIIILLLDAILGFVQEYRTEKTIETLKKLTSPTAKVWRDGILQTIDSALLVPSDMVTVETGDTVPADCEILAQNNLYCDEAILTGESKPAKKKDSDNVYMGTTVSRGNATLRVQSTGMQTKMGQMSNLISEAGEDETPLQKKLADLGKILCVICLAVCGFVAFAGILRGEPIFDMLLTGISIAIAAIPEGLPATVTISLALAVRRMLKVNALVHKLHSVETLGCATVVCTDKTGTLTQNKMQVTRLWGDNKKELFNCFVLCNNATEKVGDPTEIALINSATANGIDINEVRASHKRIAEVPFESETKMMQVSVLSGNETCAYTKGAPDVIFKTCRKILTANGEKAFDSEALSQVQAVVEEYSKNALRVLAFSKNDTLLGLCGMYDAPRPEAKKAIASLKRAKIKPVMITGDGKLTAEAIARQVGIMQFGGVALSKEELDALSDKELVKIVDKVSVFSRVDPSDKLRIVKAFKKRGHIVAMTGDGVNDAPAVKEADIGVAMGKQGTDACKQAADLILLDDDISTLCESVKSGRTVYSNIRKFVRYLISCNIGEVAVMFLSIIAGLPVILLPTPILLVNLVTDGLPAVALGLEKGEEYLLEMHPKSFGKSFFSGGLLKKIIIRGTLIGLCTLGCFVYAIYASSPLVTARTMALVTLIASQLIHVFECRSERVSIFKLNPFKNPALIGAIAISATVTALCIYLKPLATVMETTALSPTELLISLAFALGVSIVSELLNLIFKPKRSV